MPKLAGEALVGPGMLTLGVVLGLAQDVAANPPEQAVAALVQAIGTALAVGGIGYWLIQTAVKQWVAAREAQRKREEEERQAQREEEREERAEERLERQRVYEHWEARATEWRVAYEAERKQSAELTAQLLTCISCRVPPSATARG